MAEAYQEQQPPLDISIRLRDLEEKNRLLRDRVLLLGQSVIEERDKGFKEIQEMKGTVIKLKEEVSRLKELMQRMAEQITQTARKEELMILQRQLDLLRKAS
jgi:lipopolysaccharide biosynthesis regulator YciM